MPPPPSHPTSRGVRLSRKHRLQRRRQVQIATSSIPTGGSRHDLRAVGQSARSAYAQRQYKTPSTPARWSQCTQHKLSVTQGCRERKRDVRPQQLVQSPWLDDCGDVILDQANGCNNGGQQGQSRKVLSSRALFSISPELFPVAATNFSFRPSSPSS